MKVVATIGPCHGTDKAERAVLRRKSSGAGLSDSFPIFRHTWSGSRPATVRIIGRGPSAFCAHGSADGATVRDGNPQRSIPRPWWSIAPLFLSVSRGIWIGDLLRISG